MMKKIGGCRVASRGPVHVNTPMSLYAPTRRLVAGALAASSNKTPGSARKRLALEILPAH